MARSWMFTTVHKTAASSEESLCSTHSSEPAQTPPAPEKRRLILWIALIAGLLVGIVVAILGAMGVVQSSPTIALDYATYQGTTQAATAGVSQWLGMRYAAPPVASLRFQAPQDPLKQSGTIAATNFGPGCLSTDVTSQPDDGHSEDCLFVNVWAPTKSNSSSNLPVHFHMAGGGFNVNANPRLDGSGLVAASGNNIIVVTANYRVGPYGFLGGSQVAKNGSLNNGLKDQRKALKWVQSYISKFGGNPNHVVIGGESAGAASVALHLTAYGGKGEQLFAGAIAQSVSSPTMYNTTSSQFMYDALAQRAGCSGPDSFTCLQNLNASQLQQYNHRTALPGRSGNPVFLYGPVVDFDFVPDYTYNLFNAGKFFKVPTIMGADQNDGTVFTPTSINTTDQCHTFIGDNFPNINVTGYDTLDTLYPLSAYPERFANAGDFWRQCSQLYGDLRYKCPGINFLSAMARAGTATYAYRYAAVDAAQNASGLGVPHTIEVNAIWAAPNADTPASYAPGKPNADIVPEMQAYWTSFVRSLDPSTFKRAQDPAWTKWDAKSRNLILLKTNATAMQAEDAGEQQSCGYFQQVGPYLQQ